MSVDKKFVSFLGRSSLFAIISAASVLIFMSAFSDTSNAAAENKVEDPPIVSEEVLKKFTGEVSRQLEKEQEATLSAIEKQDEMLQKILDAVVELKPAPAAQPVRPVEKPEEDQTTVVPPAKAGKPNPIRMSSTTWNVKGSWNFNADELESHLNGEHGLTDIDGYSMEELKVMHDNLHNGYSALGSTMQAKNPQKFLSPVRSTRGGLFRRYSTRTMSTCPTGGCP